ncbi:MAG: hypothetical protein RJA36_1566 [Pseudomonadota bacterium]|jgi:hypothetical protein
MIHNLFPFSLDRESRAKLSIQAFVLLCLTAIVIGSALPAQTIRLTNHSTTPFEGWIRTTVDRDPPHPAGEIATATYRVGRRVGLDTHVVDVRCTLAPGEHRELDLATFVAVDVAMPGLPTDLLAHFGGWPSINGFPLGIVSLQPDGAAWLAHLRARVPGTRLLVVDLWLWWVPGQAWCHGEALVVASNPAVPDMVETTPEVRLTFGDAMVRVLGGPDGVLMPAGTVLADGQGRALPLTLTWLRHLPAADWTGPWGADEFGWLDAYFAADAASTWHVRAVGATQLLADGNPTFPAGFDAVAWTRANLPGAIARLHTWDASPLGPAGVAGSSGLQEDSLLHCGGEALQAGGVGAELVRYLIAVDLHAERPSNHLEADGSPLDLSKHPRLLLNGGRPLWNSGFNPVDHLGKPRQLTIEEAHNRYGPDTQHHYQRSLAAACRLTGSPMAQQLLSTQAKVYLLQRTTNPAWATSATEAAREWGCEAQAVMDYWRDLEDRALAQACVDRWRARVTGILVPQMVGRDLLRVWDRDPRVHATGLGAQWWQESFAADRIDVACSVLGPVEGRDVAQRIARRVLETAWTWTGDHWRAQPQGPLDGSSNAENPASDSFNSYGMPGCVAAVLRREPGNTKARAIWTQLLASTAPDARRWMSPGVQ